MIPACMSAETGVGASMVSGSPDRPRAIGVLEQQFMQAKTGEHPGDGEHQKVAGHDQHEHAADCEGQPLEEPSLACLTVETLNRKPCDHEPHRGDQQIHHGGKWIEVDPDVDG